MEQSSPIIRIPSTIGDLDLTYFNSTLRIFRDNSLDHVEYRHTDESLKGLCVGRAVMDTMFELEYPMVFLPYPREEDIEWFINLQNKTFEEELGNM